MNLSPDRLERVARLMEELERVMQAGEGLETPALAQRFDLDEEEVAQCLRAMQAFDMSLGEDPAISSEIRPPQLPGDYELRGELGRGGMGIVYRVHQKSLDREVALKVLRPGDLILSGAIKRFEREARSLARLRHRHIVSVHEVGQVEGFVYYTMDLVEGRTLSALIAERQITTTQAVRLLRQIGGAIGYAHSQGIVHRDLKPANILVDGNGDAFVVDFGLARDVGAMGAMGTGDTLTGQLLGTPAYMSPEQVAGDAEQIGEAADIYALGAILYQCLTGQAPFAGKSLARLMHAVLEEAPPPPRKINPRMPRDLEVICTRAMAKRPQDRYPTAQALVDDLERFAGGQMILARPPSRVYRFSRSLWRRRRPMFTLACTVLLVLTVAWFWILPRILGQDLVALGDELRSAGNDAGALAAYRAAVRQQDLSQVGPSVLVRYLAALNNEAGRLLFAGAATEEVKRLLDEAEACFPADIRERYYPNLPEHPQSIRDLRYEWLRFQAVRGAPSGSSWGLARDVLSRFVAALLQDPVRETDLLVFAKELAGGWRSPLSGKLPAKRSRVLFSRLLECWERLPKSLLGQLHEHLPRHGLYPAEVSSERDDEFEGTLIQVLADESRGMELRLCAFDVLHSVSDRYPPRLRWKDASNLVNCMRHEDLGHVHQVWEAVRGLSKLEAYKRRLELYARLLPETALSMEELRASHGFYGFGRWYRDHVGIWIRTRAQWSAWWGEHGDEDPRRWLLRALRWDADPGTLTERQIGEKYYECVRERRHSARYSGSLGVWMHHLLELTVERVAVPLRAGRHGTRAGTFQDWAVVLGLSHGSVQHVRLACVAFMDGDPKPQLLWQDRISLRPFEQRQINATVAHNLDYRSLRFWMADCASRSEAWDGTIPYPSLKRLLRIRGKVSLRWDGGGISGLASLDDSLTPSTHGHAGEGYYGGHLIPGWVSFLQRSGYYTVEVGLTRIVRVIPMAILEDASCPPGVWGLDQWRNAIHHTLRELQATFDGEKAAMNLLWGLEVFPLPNAKGADVRRAGELRAIADERHVGNSRLRDGRTPAFARLMAGDRSALEPAQQMPGAIPVDGAVRLALSTTDPTIRSFALERLKTLDLSKRLARTLRLAAVRGEFEPPAWLEERITQIGDPTPWGDLDGGAQAALVSIATGLFLGLVGLCFWRRSSLGRRFSALVLAVAAGFLANSRLEYGMQHLIPTWISFTIIAAALWILFWRSTRSRAWMLCPLLWTGYAVADLLLRITREQTAPGWIFVLGFVLFLSACLAAKPASRAGS